MRTKIGVGIVVSLAAVLGIWSSCGDDGGSSGYSGNTEKMVITEESASLLVTEMGGLLPGCEPGGGSKKRSVAAAMRIVPLILGSDHTWSLTSTPPADRSGPCGGGAAFEDYSHESGKTTGTISFTSYCNTEDDGTEVTLDGAISFVDNGTPSDWGPVRSSLTSSSSGLDVSSNEGDSSTVVFDEYEYTVPSPGTAATDTAPHLLTIGEIVITDKLSGDDYRVGGVNLEVGATTCAGSSELCAGEMGCVDLTTDAADPIVVDSTGALQSGAFIAEGAEGTSAKIEVVSSAGVTLTLTEVNGATISGGATLVCPLPPTSL